MGKHRKPILVDTKEMCKYGCGLTAHYQLAGGDFICENSANKCPKNKEKNSSRVRASYEEGRKTNSHSIKGKMTGWDTKSAEEIASIKKRAGNTLKSHIKNGVVVPSFTGKAHSSASKEKISKSRIKYLETHENNRCPWYEVNGIRVQGLWEKTFAERLNFLGITWERRYLSFDGHRRYTPDFYIPASDIFVEVKGFMRERDKRKMWLVLKEHNIDLRIIEDFLEIETFSSPNQLEVFKEVYPENSIDFSKFVDFWQ